MMRIVTAVTVIVVEWFMVVIEDMPNLPVGDVVVGIRTGFK